MNWLKKHFVIEWSNDWNLQPTFRFADIYFDVFMGFEFEFTLLGLGIFIRYNTDKALDKFDEWTKEVDDNIEDWINTGVGKNNEA